MNEDILAIQRLIVARDQMIENGDSVGETVIQRRIDMLVAALPEIADEDNSDVDRMIARLG